MNYTYIQSSGLFLRPDGSTLTLAYSGHGTGKNNPRFQEVTLVGPIPCGIFRMGDPVDHPELGELAIPLTPDPANQMFGRSDFWIHGDSLTDPGNASKGCIVAPFLARKLIVEGYEALGRSLEVIAQERAVSA